MIQRKQTLFLLAVAIIAILLFFIPFQSVNPEGKRFPVDLLTGFKTPSITSNIFIPLILNVLVLLISIITIFLYKNRVLQYKLANLLGFLNVFIIGLFFLLSFIFVRDEASAEPVLFKIGAFLPVLGIIFSFLAAHFIKKDEQLVRNADRIR